MTCRCIIGWVVDESVEGTHNAEAVTCAAYVAALEDLIRTGDADSLALEEVQKTHGVWKPDVEERKAGANWLGALIRRFTNGEPLRGDFTLFPGVAEAAVAAHATPEREGPPYVHTWVPEYDAEYYERTLGAFLRDAGWAAWKRPEGGVELDEDGVYRAKKSNSPVLDALDRYPGYPVYSFKIVQEQPQAVPSIAVLIFEDGSIQAYKEGSGSDRGVPICVDHDIRLHPVTWHCELCLKREKRAK